MSDQKKRLTREELYHELWQTPMSKLAATWGVPLAGIVRAANQMNVPRPGSGHWQLVARGWTVEREQLPKLDSITPTSVTIKSAQKKRAAKPKKKQVSTEPVISVADDLRQLHPQVQALHSVMKNAPVIERGPIEVAEAGNFDVWVSRKQMRRALLILDAVVKGLEARGATFIAGSGFTKHLVAQFQDGPVAFRIFEQMKRDWVKIGSVPVGTGFINNHEWRYKPSGTLTFSILDYYPTGTRKNWRDGIRQLVENKMGDIVEQICSNPGIAKLQKEKQQREIDERNSLWHEEYLRRTAPERLEEMKASLKKQIEEHGQNWEQARATREFLSACEQAMQGDGNGPIQEWQTRWLAWGKEWVNSLDPMTNGFLSSLKHQFEELEELEAFVAQLKKEKATEIDSCQ